MEREPIAAPRTNHSLLIAPEPQRWLGAIRENQGLAYDGNHVGCLTFADWRAIARREAVDSAKRYLESFDAPLPDVFSSIDFESVLQRPLVVTGHQPELYHPGVWVKSFAVSRLANAVGGLGLHVLIDNDTIKQTAVRVPTREPEHCVLKHVPFDRWESEIPYEERNVLDESVFEGFAGRVESAMSQLPFEPMVAKYWTHVLHRSERTSNLGERLSAGRRALEADLGARNLEVPLSQLCSTESFWRLVAEIVRNAGRFRDVYNQCLAEYREKHRLRSRNHPASDLDCDGDWIETPLWIWSSEQPFRQPLFVHRDRDRTSVRAGEQVVAQLPSQESSPDAFVESLLTALGEWKLRPRALLTTLYLRLALSDWFIHGIGGAKYDEVTDVIIHNYFGVQAPEFGVATATLWLPGAEKLPSGESLRQLRRRERDLYWNPDRHLDDSLREREPLASWIEEKMEWQSGDPRTAPDKKDRFERLRELNDQLRPYVSNQIQATHDRASDLARAKRSIDAYRSREFAFCLHPMEEVRSLVDQISFDSV